jgi:phage gpG-like protein
VKTVWYDKEFFAKVDRAVEVGIDYAASVLTDQIKLDLSRDNGTVTGKTKSGRNIYKGSMPGTPPAARDGTLRNSISPKKAGKGARRIGTNLVYAGIHERGGTINHPGGTAYYVTGGRFGTGAVFVSNKDAAKMPGLRRTGAHTIIMPKRPYLVPALNEFASSGRLDRAFGNRFKAAMGAA